MKKILIICTGGTIASTEGGQGLTPSLSATDILSMVPELRDRVEAAVFPLMNIDSTNMRPENWLTIAKTLEERYDDYDGFVILHGTDTMAYTAAALSYLCQKLDKCVVLTGAQQPINLSYSDGRLNLLNACTYAGDDWSHGVVTVFESRVIAGNRARKIKTHTYDAFESVNLPDIAAVLGSEVTHYLNPPKPTSGPHFYHELKGRIFPMKLIPGLDASVFDMLYERYDAVIMESFGIGGIPEYVTDNESFANAIGQWLSAGKTLVVTTQVPYEGSDFSVYKVGKHIKEKYHVLEAFDMSYESIVTKLMWVLAQTNEQEEICRLFYKPIGYDLIKWGCNNEMI